MRSDDHWLVAMKLDVSKRRRIGDARCHRATGWRVLLIDGFAEQDSFMGVPFSRRCSHCAPFDLS